MTSVAGSRSGFIGRMMGNAALAFASLFVLLPILWLVQMSLRPTDDALGYGLSFTPTLENYTALLEAQFLRSFLNSAASSTLSTLVALVLGTPAAYVLSRWHFRARRTIAMWILSTRMAPQVAFTIPFFLAFRWLGLTDTVVGLALVYLTFNLALVIWMMGRSSMRFRGRSKRLPGSTAAVFGALSDGSSCRSPRRALRQLRFSASCFPGTTSFMP